MPHSIRNPLLRNKRKLALTKTDYFWYEKTCLNEVGELHSYGEWDVFVSAYNKEERIHQVFDQIQAKRKFYFGLPEYGGDTEALPDGLVPLQGESEAEKIDQMVSHSDLAAGFRVCVDTTGIIRHYLPVLMRQLQNLGIEKFDFLYSEPARYGDKESTQFSSSEMIEVRQVRGFEGSHLADTTQDLLIIGAGYEHRLMSAVADNKNHAEKKIVFAFPSMRPDMYQESVLSTYISRESLGPAAVESPKFAPAYDPFVTASTLHSIVTQMEESDRGITNLYLAPVSSKPMTIGFALYYLMERRDSATSIILPFTKSYANRSAFGISRVWLYSIDLGNA